MGRAFRHAAAAACIATLLAPALRADVERAPWSLAARSFALAPGAIDPESLDARAGRAFDASLRSRAGIGLDVDGEFRRAGDGPATRSDLLLDAALGFRAHLAQAEPRGLELATDLLQRLGIDQARITAWVKDQADRRGLPDNATELKPAVEAA